MESRQLRHFLAACEARSFAGAAIELGLTQQAVSKSVQALEQRLGVTLFERGGRRLQPTADAELLLPHARVIAAEMDGLRLALADRAQGEPALRIGVGPSAAGLVAGAVATLLAERPRLRCRVVEGTARSLSGELVAGRLDLMVAVRLTDQIDPLLAERPLGAVDYAVLAGQRHPLAAAPPEALAGLAQAEWLFGADLGDVRDAVDASFRAAGLPPPRSRVETASLGLLLALLDRGRHLTILPAPMAEAHIRAGRLARIHIPGAEWRRPLILATRRRGASHPAAQDCIARIAGHAQSVSHGQGL